MTFELPRRTLGAFAGLALAGLALGALVLMLRDKTDTEQAASDAASRQLEQKQPAPERDGPRERRRPDVLIERFDANNNGTVELSELPEFGREQMAARDANKDGVLSLEELQRKPPKRRKNAAAVVVQLDANKNGKLEPDELPEYRREKLLAADANKDGVLSTDELMAHFASRGSGPPSTLPR